ncbi:S-layer domain protein [[Bacillus] selenitireducens MLS10]|uniref:S-layer domain protein n=2 Tax=Salisediminibacterium selenitireducens TaxID=85683 RepID=D6Y073_BACIE|nr:S-layer domain protein [[Bacillus] selenitireducens MLS10]
MSELSRKKSIIAFFLTAVLIFTSAMGVSAMNLHFSDVGETHRASEEINTLRELGYIEGFSDGSFRPDHNITRGQVALIMARSLGLMNVSGHHGETGFNDIPPTSRYFEATNALKNEGIIEGFSDGSFRPDHPITRGEMANIIVEAYDLQRTSETFSFSDQGVSTRDAVQTLYDEGITEGVSETMFGTFSNLKRSDFAIFVFRAMQEDPITVESIVFNEAGDQFAITFSDLPAGAEVANLDQAGILSVLEALDLLDTVMIEFNGADITAAALEILDLSTGSDPLDGLTLTVDHVNLNDLPDAAEGDEVTLTIGGTSGVYTILPDPITVESIVFNEAGDQFAITFSDLPAGAEVANLDQAGILSVLEALDLLDTVMIEFNGADITAAALEILDLSTGSDPLDGLTLTVDHVNLNDLPDAAEGDEVTLTIGGTSGVYTILPDPITVESIVFNEAGDQFAITFSDLPAGAEVANLDQAGILSVLEALDLLDTVMIEFNGADITAAALEILDLSTGSDPLDGLTLTVDHVNLNDLPDATTGDEVRLTIGTEIGTYIIL